MSRRTRLSIVTLLLLLGPSLREAAACSCIEPRGCAADDAAVLFVGEVLDVWTGKEWQIARIRVERALRGAKPGQIFNVASTLSSCGAHFRAGYRWLIAEGPEHATRHEGRDASLGVAVCGGSFMLAPGDPGPVFPTRSDVGGRITRLEGGSRHDRPRVVGARVWVRTPAGVIETRTDKDGDFLLRNVPLNPPARLQVDLPAGEAIRKTVLGVWTPEACRLLDVIVDKVRTR